MKEIEVKILDIDRPAVEARLVELGAELCFDGLLTALFFDFPDGRLGATGSLLRLRREGDRTVLTLKRSMSGREAKVREETEVEASCFDTCRQILLALGMRESSRILKYRTGYRLNRREGLAVSGRERPASIVIDRYIGSLAHIPEFLEIEAGTVAEVRSIAARLGFPADALRPWGMGQLFAHYEAKARP